MHTSTGNKLARFGEPLRARGLRVRVVAPSEHHHEKLDLDDLARVAIDDPG
jgi:hypothetical protein